MIHEEICTYEVCKLAREKGFNVPTDRYYHIYDDVIEAQNSLEMIGGGCADFYNSLNQCRCAASTISQVLKWLRKEKKIHICVDFDGDMNWYYQIAIYGSTDIAANGYGFKSYEDAVLAGIEYVINNLI